MWTLKVLGPLRLAGPAGSVAPGRKGEAALAWLAARPSGCGTRRALIDLLWAETSESDARNSLRQWLFQLRQAAAGDSPVLTHGEVLQLDPGCEVDLWRFRALASGAAAAAWPAACDLWEGEFAEGPPVTPRFDAWRATECEALRDAAASMLVAASQQLQGAPVNHAVALARRLLAADPLHEGVWRALMQLLARAGLHGKVVAAWGDCRRVLRTQAGIEPAAQTQALYRSLRQEGQSTLHAVRGHAAEPSPHPDDAAAQAADHVVRGLHHYFNGSAPDNALAREAFEAASRLQPHRPDLAVHAAWTHFTDFNFLWNGPGPASYLRAAAGARLLLKQFPGEAWPVAFDAKLKLWRGEFEEAVQGFARALDQRPGDAMLWANAADALARAARHADAVEHARRAVELDPQARGYPQFVLGMARFGLGELDEAEDAFESALRRNPAFCPGAGGLAAVRAEQGRRAAAQEAAYRARLYDDSGLAPLASHSLGPHADATVRRRWLRAWNAARPA